MDIKGRENLRHNAYYDLESSWHKGVELNKHSFYCYKEGGNYRVLKSSEVLFHFMFLRVWEWVFLGLIKVAFTGLMTVCP